MMLQKLQTRLISGFFKFNKNLVFFLLKFQIALAFIFTPDALAARILSLPHREEVLANGLRVYMVKYPSPGVIAYEIPVRVGSRNETEKGKTGFAHFFEHLMFRGTKKRTHVQLKRDFVLIGSEESAWTSYDVTNYHGTVAKIYLDKVLEIEGDRFQNLFFSEKLLKDEAGAVLGEYHKDVAQPEFQLEEMIRQTAFHNHPYGHTTMGYKADILEFPNRYKDVWPFFKKFYRPSNTSIVLVGDVDFEKSLSLVKKYFGNWKEPATKIEDSPKEPEQKGPLKAKVELEKLTAQRFAVGFKVPEFRTSRPEGAVMDVLSEMLFSETSPFQQKFRFEKQWIDSVDSGHRETVDPDLWVIQVRLSKKGEGHMEEIQNGILEAFEDLRQGKVDEGRLRRTKERILNYAKVGWFSAPDRLAGQIAWFVTFERDLGVLDRALNKISLLTKGDVVQFANTYLKPEGRTIVELVGQ